MHGTLSFHFNLLSRRLTVYQYETGNNAVALVTDAGLTCASVGHVSGKSSSSGGDTCATADSRWGISYNAGPKSGTTYSTWSAPIFSSNHVDLYDQSTGTDICGSAAKCNADSIKISSSGDDNIWVSARPLQDRDKTSPSCIRLLAN